MIFQCIFKTTRAIYLLTEKIDSRSVNAFLIYINKRTYVFYDPVFHLNNFTKVLKIPQLEKIHIFPIFGYGKAWYTMYFVFSTFSRKLLNNFMTFFYTVVANTPSPLPNVIVGLFFGSRRKDSLIVFQCYSFSARHSV